VPLDSIAKGRQILEDFHDHAQFCRESLRIASKQGPVVPFELQPAQIKLHAAIEKQRAAGVPVRIVFLKPRRVMISAAVAAEFFHRVPFEAGQSALVVAHKLSAARQIWNYHRNFHRKYQPFRGVIELPKAVRKPGARGAIEYENGSTIEIETAKNLDAGRAYSIRFLQLSEYAYYRNASKVALGLVNSVPDDPDTMIVKESTANGVGNAFHKDCLQSMDPTSGSGWQFVFFAWFEHPEYRLEFRSAEEKARFADSLRRDEVDMLSALAINLEQLHWRRWAIKNKCDGSVEMFHQEYPGTAEEAFLYSGRPRFLHAQLAKMPVIADAPSGDLVAIPGPRPRLVFEARDRGSLVVYKRPQLNRRYAAGIDVCEGIDVGDGTIGGEDPDWSVACFFDCDTGEQVAKLRARMEPSPFSEYVVAVQEWYNWAFLVPEANGPGIALIEGLLRNRCPPALIYHRRPQPDEQFSGRAGTALQLLGWKQNTVSRVQLISLLDAAIRELAIILHDPNTIAEHYSFIVKANGRPEHQDGCHDDEVFACALGVVGIQQPPPDKRLANRNPAAPGVRMYGQRRQDDQRRGVVFRT
jgi:hypothetical protein